MLLVLVLGKYITVVEIAAAVAGSLSVCAGLDNDYL